MQADQSYRDAVKGLNPRDDMTITLNIEPSTGIVLKALKLSQVNAVVLNNPSFKPLSKVHTVYLPVAYMNGSIVVDAGVGRLLQRKLFGPKLGVTILAYLLIGVGLTAVMASLIYLGISRRRERSQATEGSTSEATENTPLLNDTSSPVSVNPASPDPPNSETAPAIAVA